MSDDSMYSIKDLVPDIGTLHATVRHGEHYDVVSTVAFLIGVPQKYFSDDADSLMLGRLKSLQMDKNARIIRNLCILRTQMEINFLKVCKAIQQEYKSITSIPELISMDAYNALTQDGIDLYRLRKDPNGFIIELNRNIKGRINNCRNLFPEWLKWEYLQDIFVIPNGLTEEGVKKAAEIYYANQSYLNTHDKTVSAYNEYTKTSIPLDYMFTDDSLPRIVSQVGREKQNLVYYSSKTKVLEYANRYFADIVKFSRFGTPFWCGKF